MAAATLTISAGEVDSLISNPSSVIGYSPTKNIVITGNITHTQATGLKAVTSPSITATVAQTSVDNLKAIQVLSGRTNAFTFTTSDGTAAATDLNTIRLLTSVAPNFSSVTGITASLAADIKSLYAVTNTTLGNETVTVSDSTVAAADLVTINGKTDGIVTISATTITGSTADLVSVYKAFDTTYTNPATVAGLGNEIVTITDVTVNAEELRFIELATTGQVNIGTNATSIAGNYTDVNEVLGQVTDTIVSGAITDGKIAGLATLDVTLDNSNSTTFGNNTNGTASYSVANVNTIAGKTSGKVTAVVTETAIATLKGLTKAGNYTVTVATATIPAVDLKSVLDKVGTGTITATSAVTAVNGAYADVFALFNSSKVSGLDDQTNTITDSITVTQLNALDNINKGAITATISSNDMASLNQLNLNTDSAGAVVDTALTVTVVDDTIDAGELKVLDSKVKNAAPIVVDAATKITGTVADLKAVYSSAGIKAASLLNEAVTVSDTEIIAADLKAIATANSSGTITLSGVTKITGSAADIAALIANSDISGLTTANTAISITGASALAADVKSILDATTGLITIVDPATTVIKGTLTTLGAIKTAASATTPGIVGPLTAKLELTAADGTAATGTVANVNSLMGLTTGLVTATVTDSAAANGDNDIASLLGKRVSGGTDGASTLAEDGHAISVKIQKDATNAALTASKLVLLNSITTGTITVHTTITSLSGLAADVKAIYAAHGDGTAQITGLSTDKAVTITDTSLRVADVNAFAENIDSSIANTNSTTGAITVSQAGNLIGTSADLAAFLDVAEENNTKVVLTAATPTVTVTGPTAAAADLENFRAHTREAVGAITITSGVISGTDDNLKLVVKTNKNAYVGEETADLLVSSGEITAGIATELAAITTGTITGTLAGGNDLTTLLTALTDAAKGHNLNIELSEALITMDELKLLNTRTDGKITFASTALTIRGTAGDIEAAIDSGTSQIEFTNQAMQVLGGATVAQINKIAGATTGTVTATITDNDIATLEGITETNHDLDITVTDATVEVSKIISVAAKTTQAVTIGAGTTNFKGTFAELSTTLVNANTAGTLIQPASANALNAKGLIVNDAITVANANTLTAITGIGNVTATISDTTMEKLDDIADTAGGNIFTITVTDTEVDAGTLETLEGDTNGLITLNGTTTIRGSAAEVKAVMVTKGQDVLTNGVVTTPKTIAGTDAVNVTIDSGTKGTGTTNGDTIANVNEILQATTGIVTATLTTNDDTQAQSSDIDALLGARLGGAAADVANYTIAEDGHNLNIRVHREGATNDITASKLVKLNSITTGLITITSNIDLIQGASADVRAIYEAHDATPTATTQITGIATNMAISVNDEALSASDLAYIDSQNGTGHIAATSDVDSVVGSITDITTVYSATGALNAASKISGIADEPITITGTATVDQINVLDDGTTPKTSAAITATISDGSSTELATLASTGHNLSITITDTEVTAANLKTINLATATAVDATQVTKVTGLFADIKHSYDTQKAGITGLGNETLVATDTTASPAKLSIANANLLSGYTTGLAKASLADSTKLQLDALTSSSNEYSVTVTDPSIDAGDLNAINAKTAGLVTVDATAITGALTDVKAAYAANSAGTISALGNESVAISDSGSVLASDVNFINGLTAGVITLNNVSTVKGLASEVLTTYAANTAGTVTGLGNEDIILTDTSLAASDLNLINTKTTKVVTASDATTITGSYTDVNEAYAANTAGTVSGLGNEAVTVSDGNGITIAQANALDLKTNGVITSIISTKDIDSLSSLTGTTNAYTISVTDSSVSATKLNALNAKTTGSIAVSSETITGAFADIKTAYTATGVTGLGSEAITASGTLTVSQVNTLGGYTTGTLTATVSDGDVATLKGIAEAGNALSITVTDSSVSATDLTTMDAGTTSVITVNSTTLTGTDTQKLAAYAAQNAGGIAGLGKTFDASSYLASHEDLLKAFGSDTVRAKSHFFEFGVDESRSLDSFDEKSYLASYSDLLAAFGKDTTKATTHYSEFGFGEGREVDTFDDLGYIASYSDLIGAFGTDKAAAVDHYINFGYTENRSVTFDAKSYLAGYSDLRTAFGTNEELAKQHYIEHGFNEGRVIA